MIVSTILQNSLLFLLAVGDVAGLSGLEAQLQQHPDDLKLGSRYRQEAIRQKEFDRSIRFFKQLTAANTRSAHCYVNLALANVDKIPAAGFFSQVSLGNSAIDMLNRALAIKPSWIAYYTRGQVSLYWPKALNRTKPAIADLEHAIALQAGHPNQPYFVKSFIALGDAYWKLDQLPKARDAWKQGLTHFPGNSDLQARFEKSGKDLDQLIGMALDKSRRVDTDLSLLADD